MLDKTYRPAEVEPRIYAAWEAAGAFRPRPGGAPFCIMLPPPNVTGSLHMGHALDQTIQDVLVRFQRMRGREVLWQPGTDHAGIATQMVVERKLAAEGKDRRTLGREAFLREVWAWKEQSGGTIVRQMRRLGASCDWSRERFTMDEGLSRAVRRAFVLLYRAGLVYRDKRLVNWDCALETAVSDLEVQNREVDGKLWYIRYPIEGEPGRAIVVATTRPETMLGDTGVAVHPDDPRYRDLVGRFAVLPLVGRRLPIVADPATDPEKGTGAVKVTPAHDFADFAIGRRHGLETIAILDSRGRLNDAVPAPYRGLDRFEARARVVADLEAQGFLVKVEPWRHVVPYGDRSGTPLEPFLTDQWFCEVKGLAERAIAAVREGRTRFVPKAWETTFFNWLEAIQPWCISRQLWWGHQIPAWYGPDGRIFVAEEEEEAFRLARAHYGADVPLVRDPDVLDTWFSSALWPFSTLGWPERTPELEKFYPTDVLVTGFDIIFFWVARMMMLGLFCMNEVPFRDVYIHGLVRDERGKKMSKTLGNVVDPLELVDKYGADALRLALLAATEQGRDVRFGESRVEGWRNFVTKLWNAARFAELNGARWQPDFAPHACRLPLNRWIAGEISALARRVTEALLDYRLSEATMALYHFVWDDFCDWWIELAKPLLAGDDPEARAETQATGGFVLARVLHLLHPFAPFVTEELWRTLFGAPGGLLVLAPWPEEREPFFDASAAEELGWLVRAIGAIRAARTELNVPPSARLALLQQGASPVTRARLERYREAFERLARIGAIELEERPVPRHAIVVVVDETTFALPVGEVVDLERERERLAREIAKTRAELDRLERRLADSAFLARAPAEVVEESRERLSELARNRARLEAALARIA
ncbi:MAG: valine--tRNA ligase [Geminicoccaceae bacterium]|nr:valine--tRNA ligase [Geminicoccaceae bacterium]MDW8339858.1 valine--tRNA ligase [Geminicoccaceae bacterium]